MYFAHTYITWPNNQKSCYYTCIFDSFDYTSLVNVTVFFCSFGKYHWTMQSGHCLYIKIGADQLVHIIGLVGSNLSYPISKPSLLHFKYDYKNSLKSEHFHFTIHSFCWKILHVNLTYYLTCHNFRPRCNFLCGL